MFSQHVSRHLSSYCHGELSEEESRRVAEHLIGCGRCRREFEAIKLGVKFAEQLPRVSAPASLWSEIEAAALESSRPQTSRSRRDGFIPRLGWRPLVATCAVVLFALAIVASWYLTRQPQGASQIAEQGAPPQTKTSADSTQGNSSTTLPASSSEEHAQASSNGDKGRDTPPLKNSAGTWEVARVE